MIYLFSGSDVDKVREKAFEWVEKARAKEPNLLYKRLAREDLSLGTLTEAADSLSCSMTRSRLRVRARRMKRARQHPQSSRSILKRSRSPRTRS